ncbi:VOC family protein [Rhodococcoides kyotonense]|uniref:Glyoxalase/Bleomycin resistance protein/Dioxygenase superfamily protein n=1 Tax=Rhodococcoides kyotonense TaxID=398843 RepID=A0A239ND87_9NOCA|nr:VOC family protein [Rhodococcus kyotonensis]SNT52119.1 Glyoxalase/Bleomycin resistance protein/Dioxygenase superfamily protein [Rhodococcus kyotonensis]
MPEFPGLAHVAITVSDLSASTAWYSRLFGSDPVLDEDSGNFHHTVFAIGGGMLFGLHTHPGHSAGEPFDEHRVGLDHVGFGCTQEELQAWPARLDELKIDHSGIKHDHYGSGLSFRDPDNIALEFFAPPA